MKKTIQSLLLMMGTLGLACEYTSAMEAKDKNLLNYTDSDSKTITTTTLLQPIPEGPSRVTIKVDVTSEGTVIPMPAYIGNGDAINFAALDAVGKVIRAGSAANSVKNQLGLSHSGIAILETPTKVRDIILDLTRPEILMQDPTINSRGGELILDTLHNYHSSELSITNGKVQRVAFVMESNGTAEQVMRLVAPHIMINPIKKVLGEYDGNVYYRNLKFDVDFSFTEEFMKKHLLRPYEKISTSLELIKATVNANEKEKVDNLFCSEMSALFYRDMITTVPSVMEYMKVVDVNGVTMRLLENVSNIIPEELGSSAGKDDILQYMAYPDTLLKFSGVIAEEPCCGSWFFKLFGK